jgi:drug/metabolite transporter (DMT)-like permease
VRELSRYKTIGLITFLVVIWGISWPIYKIALAYTPPLLFGGIRTFFGGLLLLLLYISQRKQLRWKENWRIYVISSVFNVILLQGLQTVGLMYMPSGLFSVIVFLQPVLVGILAWFWLGEPMTAFKVLGLIVGFLGVVAISTGGLTGHIVFLGIALALMSAVDWAVGTVYVKKVSHRVDSIWLVAMQSIIGGSFLLAAGSVSERWANIVWNAQYLSGAAYGIILGISASWVVYYKLVDAGEASKVASYTFLVPLISIFVGTLFLNEPFSIYLLIGLLLIATSIYMVSRKAKPNLEQCKMVRL